MRRHESDGLGAGSGLGERGDGREREKAEAESENSVHGPDNDITFKKADAFEVVSMDRVRVSRDRSRNDKDRGPWTRATRSLRMMVENNADLLRE